MKERVSSVVMPPFAEHFQQAMYVPNEVQALPHSVFLEKNSYLIHRGRNNQVATKVF